MGIDERGPGMDESSSDDTRSGVTRRDAIKKGAIVGGTVMWVAPLVQTVGMSPASAQVPSPPGGGCTCGGSNSFDVTATFSGAVSGTVGPIMDFPADGQDCLANVPLSVTAPGTANAFLTSDTDCVGGTSTGTTCSSFVQLEGLHTDLRTINPALHIQLDASVVRAQATCTCGGGCEARACITQASGQAIVRIGGVAAGPLGTGAELCSRQSIGITGLPGVTGTIVLNDTSSDPCQATVATIDATVGGTLGVPPQTVSIVIARATAVCNQG